MSFFRLPLFVLAIFSFATLQVKALAVEFPKTEVNVLEEDSITYLNWDNETQASVNDLAADPLLILRTSPRRIDHKESLPLAWKRVGESDFFSEEAVFNEPLNEASDSIEEHRFQNSMLVTTIENHFDHIKPVFGLKCSDPRCDRVWWQISTSDEFASVPSSLDSIQEYTETVILSDFDETFLDNHQVYFFRAKGSSQGIWSDWSEPLAFTVEKPASVANIWVEKHQDAPNELVWEADQESGLTFLIFGSNSIDFIPEVYSSIQVDAMLDGLPVAISTAENLLAETDSPRYPIEKRYAYYRILAKKQGQLSNPSHLFPYYDGALPPERNLLQKDASLGQNYMKRMTCLPAYSWMQKRISSEADLPSTAKYVQNPYVSEEIWSSISPYFLPENFPQKEALDKIFSKRRVLSSASSMKKADFVLLTNPKKNIVVARHPKLKGYLVKAYLDDDKAQEWVWLRRRVEGARVIQESIENHGYQGIMKTPKKWIYPLPPDPKPKSGHSGKNFVLIVEEIDILNDHKNRKAYRTRMTPPLLDALYTILMENRLIDSIYAKNVPFCKDGRLAFVDTEHFNDTTREVPISRVAQYLSKEMHAYWEQLIQQGVQH